MGRVFFLPQNLGDLASLLYPNFLYWLLIYALTWLPHLGPDIRIPCRGSFKSLWLIQYSLPRNPTFFLTSQLSLINTGWLSDLHSLLSYILLPSHLMDALQPVLENPGQGGLADTHASVFATGAESQSCKQWHGLSLTFAYSSPWLLSVFLCPYLWNEPCVALSQRCWED